MYYNVKEKKTQRRCARSTHHRKRNERMIADKNRERNINQTNISSVSITNRGMGRRRNIRFITMAGMMSWLPVCPSPGMKRYGKKFGGTALVGGVKWDGLEMEEVVGRTTALGGCVLYKDDWDEMGWYNHQRQLKLQDVKRENRSTKRILDTKINSHYKNEQKNRNKKWSGMSWYVFTCHLFHFIF